VAVGQQCARRPLPLLPALAKLLVAALLAALAMMALGHAGGGRLGTFGDAGVDQTTFGPAVFIWFTGIGALTVAMTGGIARRPKRGPAPEVDEEPVDVFEPEPGLEPALPPQPDPRPQPQREPDVEPAAPEPMPDPAPDDGPVEGFDDPEEHFMVDDDGAPDVTRKRPSGDDH